MNDESMTKEQLLDELRALRKEVDRFREAEAERQHYEKELKERVRFLAGVLEASPIVFTITRRKDGRFMLVNPAHGRESGYTPSEVLGKTSLELNMYVNKADRDAFVKILEETGELNNFEVQYRNKDGSVRDVLLFARPLVYAGEACMLTASLPITERKRAEQKIAEYRDHLERLVKERTAKLEKEITERYRVEKALRESEAQKRAILDGITINLAFVNENLEILWANKASADSVNRNADEMIGRKCHEFWADPNAPCDGCPAARAFKTKRTEQTIMHTPDGRVWDEKGEPVFDEKGELIGVLEIAHDITARARSEEALRESEEKYRHIFNNAQVGIFRTRISDGKVLECNDRFARTYGYKTPEECMADFVVSEHYTDPGIREKMVATLMEKGEVNNQEACFSREDGEDVWVRFSARVYPEMGYLEGVGYDITEEKKALKALQKGEERYRTLVDNLPVAVYRNTPGPEGAFLTANPAFCKMFGFENEEEVKEVAPADLYANPKERQQYSDNLIEKGVLKDFERTLLKKDGTPVHTSITSRVVYGKDGEVAHFDSIMLDVTEKKSLETQLQQAQKMEAVATLAGGVAHEFNNALMGIVGNMELLKMDLPEDERRDKYFNSMKSASYRMSRLTDQLLAYAQGGKYQPKNLKLDDFVIQTLPILQYDLKPAIRVETHFEKDIPHIKADYTQMQMVLSAILANSNEAIEDEGFIRITAENKDLDADFTKQYPGLKPGLYVCLTVEDDGKGMDEEIRSGIFEPFFTTKFQGRGMGMAAVYGIIKNHDGWIYVDSELGKGTTVRIYLPAISAGSREGATAVTQPEVELGIGEGTILVIEDEEVVIEVTQTMLERLGYRVMVARTGKDAIHIAETFDGQIDLALLDIKLPDMEGGRVYPLIMKARPDLKVIVFSGFAIEGPAREILNAGAQDFIQKPFSLATLSEKLKEVLGD